MTDEQLLKNFIAGDLKSYEELVERYSAKVFRLSYQFVKNQFDAEEVIQDVFTAVFRKAGSFNGTSAVGSWIYRITVNFSLMKLRKGNRKLEHSIMDQDFYVTQTNIEDQLINRDLVVGYQTILATLNPASQKIIYLRDVDGLSTSEVGKKLGMTESAVKSKLHRARTKLKQLLVEKQLLAA